MIGLNIMTDFCSYWWLWWILPFLLGWFLGIVIMKKWRRMYEDLTKATRKQKNTMGTVESSLAEKTKEAQDLKGQLAIQRGRISELEAALKNKA